MKTTKSIIRLVILSYFLLLTISSFSQQKVWSSKINALKVFIENKGQLNNFDIKGSNIEYCYLGSQEKFYFTKNGVIVKIEKEVIKKNLATWARKIFKNESEEKENISVVNSIVYAEWINTNKDYSIETEGCANGYFTFDKSQVISYGYKKLVYKNIYPNIDIVYTIPNDSSGIEYSLIVRPGADLSKVKLQYNGDVNKMKIINGNVEIETPSGSITEHAPKSFYENEKTVVASSFELKNKTISFYLPSYNPNKVLIIDPWIASIATNINDVGFNVDFDDSLQLYTYIRSINPIYVCKYSQAGTLLWTHLSTYSTTYEGDFLVDKSEGKVYISEGFNGSGAVVYRLNYNGITDGWVSQLNPYYVEIWDMQFDETSNNVIALGGGTSSNLTGGIINIGTGALSLANFSGLPGICQDIVCGTIDSQGKLFVIYSKTICGTAGQIDNKIELVNSTLSGPVWLMPSKFNTFLESSNHRPPYQTSNGFNALAVNDNNLFYYDGGGLAAYSKITGARLDSTSVEFSGTFYTPLFQGGIAVDNCNNVYVGGPNSNILIYNFDGSLFSAPQNMPLGYVGNQRVFDVKYDNINKLLFVSGYNNVGVFEAPLPCLTSINENIITNENNIQVYPNPASEYTTVKMTDSGKYTFELIEITGKVVKSFEMESEMKIYTGDLKRGIYLIKVVSDKNRNIKLVKLSVR